MLAIDTGQERQIRRACEVAYPEEGCGILLGRQVETCKHVLEVRPTANAWDEAAATEFSALADMRLAGTRRHNFAIAPVDLLAAQKAGRAAGREIVGIFHSHVDGLAVPSEFDRAIAWAEYDYIIVAVAAGRAIDLRCWRLDGKGQFREIPCRELKGG